MSNTQHDIEELLVDDSFVRWIKREATEDEEIKWNNWLKQDPSRLDLVNEARHVHQSLTFEEELPSTIRELNRLRKSVDRYESSKKTHLSLYELPGKSNSYIGYWASAAVVLMLLVAVLVMVQTVGMDTNPSQKRSTKPVYSTATTKFGQLRRLTLWDGSKVILSADSKLTYPTNYEGGNLNVKLDGEAYFSIVHKTGKDSRTFTVQTTEGKVTVLGTKFNVNTRSDETEVVLEEGKVYLEVSDTLSAVKSNYYYTMKPGERALLSPQREGINVQSVDPVLFTSWRNLEFRFKNTPLSEIAERIKQYYGVKVEFRDASLKNVKFSGSVTNKSFVVLLHGLRTLLNIPIAHEKDTIVFGG